MKKLLAILLAVLMMGGVFAIGASAITREEYATATAELSQAFADWTKANGVPDKLKALNEKQIAEYNAKVKTITDQYSAVVFPALLAQDWDAAMAGQKVFHMQLTQLTSSTLKINVPQSLWTKVGGTGTAPSPEPAASSFLTTVWQFILKWILFGWLWNK